MGAVALGAALETGACRVKAMFDAEHAAQRHVLTWERNAEFCHYMGLDPVVVLGPKPAPLAVGAPRLAVRPPVGQPSLVVA